MHFGSQVVLFDFSGIPMVGNLDNGFVVGLTPEGAALCKRMHEGEVSEEEARSCDEPLYECLAANGFFSEPTTGPILEVAYLHVTQRCNLACVGCYSLDEYRNTLADAPTEAMLHAIDELARAGCLRLIVSGGEPFLRSDLPQLMRHAKDAGIRAITVITNGTRVHADTLAEMAPYVDTIAISFDGHSSCCPAHIRGEQRFDTLIDAVRLVQKAGISAHITPTIHAKNVGDLQAYVDLAASLGATMNYSLLSCDYGDPALADLLPGEAELEALADGLLAMGSMPSASGMPSSINLSASVNCGAGAKEVSIDADGAVYPCHMLHRPEWRLGSIFEEPLADILASEKTRELAAIDVSAIEDCVACDQRYLCGGCRARSLFRYGDLTHRDAYCTMTKTYYDKLGASLAAQG